MTKGDWRRIIAAFAILALLWATGGFIAADQYRRLAQDEERIEQLNVDVTASLCLQAFAPERGNPSERDLVLRYVEDRPVPLDLIPNNDVCQRALDKARAQARGDEPD